MRETAGAGRSVHVLGALVTKLHTGIGFVRALVVGEARVAVNSEERATNLARIGYEMVADLLEPRLEHLDEPEKRVAYFSLVAVLVFSEPLAVVVFGELS